MARNNELEDFWKTVNKTTLASKELSTQVNDNGTGYKPGTKEDNQDLAAKKALKKQIDLINSIIWNTSLTPDASTKRPLSKMTIDIINQVKEYL